jgi:TRAP-type transport system small permease protein
VLALGRVSIRPFHAGHRRVDRRGDRRPLGVLRSDAHIRITVLQAKLGPRGQRWLELVATLLAIMLCGFLLYHAVRMVYDTFSYDMRADSISETPLYLPQLTIPIGLLGLELQLLARFFRRLPFCSANR